MRVASERWLECDFVQSNECEDEEELAHNLVHLAACAKSYFQYFVESVSIEEEYDGQNSPGSEESN